MLFPFSKTGSALTITITQAKASGILPGIFLFGGIGIPAQGGYGLYSSREKFRFGKKLYV
jgi:hypothetical protein